MAISLSRFPWLWLGGKDKEQVSISNGSVKNSLGAGEWGLGVRGEGEKLKLYSMKKGDGGMRSNRKLKRKWKSREERRRRIEREYDMVVVPSDGVGLSGSESDDSDWSIGWMEPHAPDFLQTDHDHDGDGDDTFAVLVPCYRHHCHRLEEPHHPTIHFLPHAGGIEYMEQWLSSLRNS